MLPVREEDRRRRHIFSQQLSPQEVEGVVNQHPARFLDDRARATVIVISHHVTCYEGKKSTYLRRLGKATLSMFLAGRS